MTHAIEAEGPGLKLTQCNVRNCEAMCCHDGAYLMGGEEEFLVDLVSRVPDLKAKLPADFVVDGYWQGEPFGRKTATRDHDYKNPNFPSHFPRTRCVFADPDGYCELEKLARSRGLHPWKFKPAVCWLFPLSVKDGEVVPPPVDPQLDPYRSATYPGYVTVVPCGRHDPSGRAWPETLDRELKYFNAASGLPVLGSAGNCPTELLEDGHSATE